MGTPISALQRNASAVIRRIGASGLPEEITDRGRVVAVLLPPPRARGLARLRAVGATIPPESGDLGEILGEDSERLTLGLAGALAEQRDLER